MQLKEVTLFPSAPSNILIHHKVILFSCIGKLLEPIYMLVISLQDEIDSALASGMNGYITKPVNKEELFSVLSQYLVGTAE